MASKQNKTGKGISVQKPKVYSPQGIHSVDVLTIALHGLLGGLAYYFLHPVLAFKPVNSESLMLMMTALSAGLAAFGTTGLFKQHIDRIILATIPLIILHVLANVMLTYGWIETNGILVFLANALTIPLAIPVYFILKYKSVAPDLENSPQVYSVSKVFAGIGPKVAAFLILLISVFLIFYRLGYYDIWEDENLVINAAVGVYEQGFSYLKEGYDRAWLHTVMCAGVFEVFGVSEFTGRLPSAIFGIAFVLFCFYVFARWYGLAWLALLIPLICLMNDRFLILFRYMRMYALLIPLFLICVYLISRAISKVQQESEGDVQVPMIRRDWIYVVLAVLSLPLLAHVHKLSMIVLPAFGLLILYLVILHRTKAQIRLLWAAVAGTVIILILTFGVQLDSLRMFRQVAVRILSPHTPMTAYFEYMFQNGLPLNSTLMFLLSGLGLLGSKITRPMKTLLILNYLFITIAVVAMVYLIGNEGRDYRYIAHIVPFAVCTLLIAVHYYCKALWKGSYPWAMIVVFLVSTLQLVNGYGRLYERHPWAPRYSKVYATLREQYKPGDALFATNIKTYYLDAVALAGTHYHKVPKKKAYTLEQLKADARLEGHGWFLWEWHKTHQIREEVVQYIYKNFKPVHNSRLDDLGVELFYFDETMIR